MRGAERGAIFGNQPATWMQADTDGISSYVLGGRDVVGSDIELLEDTVLLSDANDGGGK